ncbi:hypothetical protein NDU88_001138 [Pleurodeles waltl]|uniref:Uncharacterized protein n=1 Tax=Pleurodeles waltl TaxID=8319 RepID=A0AAV7Q670_PLEWA|nr:hypothetical protein NDU88_001138 [Pleurodeles waltl]
MNIVPRADGSQSEQTARRDLPPCCTFPINPSPGWATRKFSAITASDFGVAWKWDPVQHRADPENLDPLTDWDKEGRTRS